MKMKQLKRKLKSMWKNGDLPDCWVASDKNGSTFIYTNKPTISENEWEGYHIRRLDFNYYGNKDWTKTLWRLE